jgi:hypothetical protein
MEWLPGQESRDGSSVVLTGQADCRALTPARSAKGRAELARGAAWLSCRASPGEARVQVERWGVGLPR